MSQKFGPNFSYQIEKNMEHFFSKIMYHKNKGRWKSYMPINSNKLKCFENKVYELWWFTRRWCDYRTLSNYQSKAISCAKCFDISNDSNSNFKRIDCSEINKLSNYKINIVLNENDNGTTYDFDGISTDILPDNFAEIKITKNNSHNYDEYFIDLTEMWWKSYTLFRIQFYSWVSENARQAEIVVYGTCCRLESLYREFHRYYFLQRLLTRWCDNLEIRNLILMWLDSFYYTRYDFRIDFFIPDEDVKPLKPTDIFTKSKDSEYYTVDDVKDKWLTSKEYFNRKGIYTWWSAWIRSNKYIFCRQYHKKIDIIRNWDEELYADYHQYDGIIRRLEFEFGSRFLTSRDKIYITNWDDYLVQILINEYLWVSSQTGPFSKKYDKVPEIDFDSLDVNKRTRQLSYMATVWDRLYRSWRDVIWIFLQTMANKYNYDDKDVKKIIDRFITDIDTKKWLWFDNHNIDDFDIQDIDIS